MTRRLFTRKQSRLPSPRIFPAGGPKRGRIVLLGLGADGDGHARVTLGDHFRLVGGSEPVHGRMQDVAVRIVQEAEREGLFLDDLAQDQIPAVREIVARCLESACVQ